jgi:FdhE protein
LNLLKGEGGKRYSLCSYCGYEWRIDRLSCAVCGNKEQQLLSYFCGEGEEAHRIDLCDICHHYIKTIDYRTLEASDPSLEDIATLHLDILASQKGYKRPVPNSWSTKNEEMNTFNGRQT